jgi:hypothetical protein
MDRPLSRALAGLLVAVFLTGAVACSAEGNVDTKGDGIKVEGDVDQKE